MAKISELTTTPVSGYNHIDALLNSSPDWNHFQPAVANTIVYSFVLRTQNTSAVNDPIVFTPTQQFYARLALAELAKYTGIKFVESQDPTASQFVLCNADINLNANTTGLASWNYGYDDLENGEFTGYEARGTLYMDNKEWGTQNANLMPGTKGYETLLHELGHLIGLKHPHDVNAENPATLPAGQDGAYYTVMSYSSFSQPGQTFAMYDIAALRWLYGGDGLGGARGVTSAGMYLTGTPFVDQLNGGAGSDLFDSGFGNDVINGGAGIDYATYDVPRYLLTLTRTAEGFSVDDGSSVDQLVSVERINYSGGAIALDIAGNGGQAYRIYNTAFDRPADLAGVGFWIAQLDKGVSLRDVAAGFMQSEEFIGKYGANPTNQAFVETVYQNVLNRAGDTAGINYWVDSLNNNVVDRAWVMAFFSESDENIANLAPVIGNGFPYEPYV